ncbi:HaeII family restriction endonuclease [Dethiosulfovibrio salsuginis]|uniref:HaeII restriction endonuclease n=1 Tax=Dethiosulfovibrio salsuginis TaxID=561720 RepID=A0A1X7IL86_9BACT|nr:HaeII family restriction endonuclease [Dethiosulfovibrio salsuginis]SMG15576.1 HaeII restriction endonuclease [Dethiosulfovibrio salsuginis]
MTDILQARESLDKVIDKSRVHLYKPIQIAEILYQHRITKGNINLNNLEEYRNDSKRWRDDVCRELLGRVCTSSAKYQDNLFEKNALPPEMINELGRVNLITGGAVEAYIYNKFTGKHSQLIKILDYCKEAAVNTFNVEDLINSFREQPGLKRSLDKVYEVVVYALFHTLLAELEFSVEISMNEDKVYILEEFSDFADKVMCLNLNNKSFNQKAKIFRVGVTNASDRGLDMYSNWGPVIQVKHLSLEESLAQEIVDGISSDRIIIVCKKAEQKVINSLLTQIGWRNRIQSIVTEEDLVLWYEKALRGNYSATIGRKLLTCLENEILEEFPSVGEMPDIIKKRNYGSVSDEFWLQLH